MAKERKPRKFKGITWLQAAPIHKMFPEMNFGDVCDIVEKNPGKNIHELAEIIRSQTYCVAQ